MNVEPKLESRGKQPYLAVRTQVGIPFGEVLPALWEEVAGFLASKNIEPSGPPFIRYLTTDMAKKLNIEVGFPVAKGISGNARITAGTFPEGRYAVLPYFGHFDNLVLVTAEFLAWAEKNNITWQTTVTNGVEMWLGRIEWYPTNPAVETDPQKWQPELAFLVK